MRKDVEFVHAQRDVAGSTTADERRLLFAEELGVVAYEWDVQARTVVRSPGLAALLGFGPAELSADAGWWERRIHPDDVDVTRVVWYTALDDSGAHQVDVEYRVRHRDGGWRRVRDRAVIMRDDDARAVRVVGVTSDVTPDHESQEALAQAAADALVVAETAARARAEAEAVKEEMLAAYAAVYAELRAAREGAEGAGRFKNELLAVVSHELRGPLAPARALAHVLARADELPPEFRTMAAEIEQHIADEARLIDDLLDYDRAGRGLLSVDCRRCDLHDVARRAMRMAAPAFRVKGMPVTEAFEADAPIAWADPLRARQIVFNLLRNAVTFAPAGTPVIIRTRNPTEDQVELAVIDAGYGISPEQLPRLFEPFLRSGGRPNPSSGMGLGLAFSRRLAALQGGTLTAASEGRGRGATFTLRLPIAQAAGGVAVEAPPFEADAEKGTAVGATGERPLRILVIDDETSTARAIARFLKSYGHLVDVAEGLASAERAAAANPPDVLLCDLQLEGESGLDAPRRIAAVAARDGWPAPPAVVLSGFASEDDFERSHAAGFVAHLTKPVDGMQLLAALRGTVESVVP
jgi:PAS domain S-box-containing protein